MDVYHGIILYVFLFFFKYATQNIFFGRKSVAFFCKIY